MLGVVVYGTYYLRQKLTAFRNDYCIQCKAPHVALQYRSFEVGHVFWIPILPKGFWKRWVCRSCGRDPHWQVASSGVKWLGIVLLGLLALSTWTTSPEKTSDATMLWVLRLGLPIAVLALWSSIGRSRISQDKIRGVRPYAEQTCPACGGRLGLRGRGRSCGACGAVQENLSAA
jgi:hypothetical protein